LIAEQQKSEATADQRGKQALKAEMAFKDRIKFEEEMKKR